MTKQEIEQKIARDFGDHIEIQQTEQPEPFVYISRGKYTEFCKYLRDDPELAFDFLFQLGGTHFPDDRFEVFLCLSSHPHQHEMVVKVKLSHNNPEINTVIDIWRGADFFELEMMELFGIKVVDHPHPRPLLLYEEWDYGYPMRKGWTGPDYIPMPDKGAEAD
jgi:NADH-quinone oxidoreductase subunit C